MPNVPFDDDAAEVKSLIAKEGRKAVLIAGDLQNADYCRAVIKKAVDELGGIDILVNNAAHQATFKDIGDISDEDWRTARGDSSRAGRSGAAVPIGYDSPSDGPSAFARQLFLGNE
ncbi:MAG: hypothetical protein QOJ86_693 [Bradyrhizobium sp.]|jgi:hypothetical protein|nr:hypothetical protein [Bradyrhizobium sp.]